MNGKVPKLSPRQYWRAALGIVQHPDNHLPRAFLKNAWGQRVPPEEFTVDELRSIILSAYAVVGP